MGWIPNGSPGDERKAKPPELDSIESPVGSTRASGDSREPLSPAISNALEEGFGTLRERLALIRKHSPRGQRYDFLSEAGRGAMGRVLRVWDRVLQRELALKLVHTQPLEGLSQAERADADLRTTRFIDEARITGQLDHPGIVPVYELAFDDQDQLYFAMPLVRGHTLAHIFEMAHRGQRGWTLRRVMDVLHKVCLTVAFAHSKGVVHRDLKPDNIMVGPFGETFVMDWGLALIEGKSERPSFLGTPGYMAPEQVDAPQLVGPRSDVYALGAILYRCLKGSMPHQATLDATRSEFMDWSALVSSAPRAINSEALGVPPELVAICQRAMHPNVEERYAGALELAEDLERWLEGRVVRAHDTHNLTRLKKWSLRNRAMASLALILPAALGLGFVQQYFKVRTVQAKNRTIEEKAYSLGLLNAQQNIVARELTLAKLRLEECPEDLRGWEWQHLRYTVEPGAETLSEGPNAITSVAVASQPDRMALGTDVGLIHLYWDSKTPLRLACGSQTIEELLFHPDRPLLIAASEDHSIRLFDTTSASLLAVYDEHAAPVQCLALNADGSLLVSGDRAGRLLLRRLDTGELLAEVATQAERISAVAFDPGGSSIVVCTSTAQVMRWDLVSASFREERGRLRDSVSDMAFTPDGSELWVSSGTQALGLDPRDFSVQRELMGQEQPLTALAIDGTGKRLLSACTDGSIWMWDLATGRHLADFVGHSQEVNDVVFLPQGLRFLSGSEDESARIWSDGSQHELTLGSHLDWVEGLAFDARGSRLASVGRDGSLRLWNALDGLLEQVIELEQRAYDLAWLDDQRLLLYLEDTRFQVLQLSDPGSLKPLVGADQNSSPLAAMTVHRATGQVLGRNLDNTLFLWESAAPGLRFQIQVEETFNYCQAFHPSGESFGIGLEGGRVSLHAAADGRLQGLLEGRDDSTIVSLAYSPDGKRLAAGNVNRQIFIWDLGTRELLLSMEGHEGQVTSLAYSPDGARLVSGSLDRTVRIWEPQRGELLLTLDGHERPITRVAFDPQGTQIASASKDGKVRLWRTRNPGSSGF